MTASEEVKAYLTKAKAEVPTEEQCLKTLITLDGKGKEEKTKALYYLLAAERSKISSRDEVAKLQRQKFLLETRLQEYREDRRKWLEGTDNAVLRERIYSLVEEIKQKNKLIQELQKKSKPPALFSTVCATPKAEPQTPPERIKVAVCFYCNEILERPTTDHFIPSHKGGPNWKINKVAACKKCNNSKGNKLPTDEQIRKFFALWEYLGIDWRKFLPNSSET